MIRVLIGHRGAGKTSFLKKLLKENPHLLGFDLDEEIEKEISIESFFLKHKEHEFRKKEQEVFKALAVNKPDIICLGAGFDLSSLSSDFEILWIRRESDKEYRIFFDRPRLKPQLSALEESKALFLERNSYYKKKAHRVLTLPEGQKGFKASEFLQPKDFSSLSTTVLDKKESKAFSKNNFKFLELRSDLFKDSTEKELKELLSFIDETKRLLSFRSQDHLDFLASQKGAKDWPLELKNPPSSIKVDIFSLHESSSMEEAIKKLNSLNLQENQHIKLAVEVRSFKDLKKGHLWQQAQPKRRSFLPRSQSGRWRWYRVFMQKKQKLNFFRAGESNFLDQPFFFELREKPFFLFAAILGNPVEHSLTPSEHKSFFETFNQPVLTIPMNKEEASYESFKFLKSLGLRACAITSPLKKKVYRLFPHDNNEGSYNTLFLRKNKIVGGNTDIDGFRWIFNTLPQNTKEVVLWGGGGVIEPFKKVFSQGLVYSSKKGEPKKNSSPAYRPDVLIWAVPPHRPFQKPPSFWKFKAIFDLNYKHNSFAKQLALQTKADYFSGHKFFEKQALEQRKFWKPLIHKEGFSSES